jgi:hypothetical protein
MTRANRPPLPNKRTFGARSQGKIDRHRLRQERLAKLRAKAAKR